MASTATVTVLFTAVVGSIGMRTSRGDAAAQEIMHAHDELVRQQIEQHSGQEVKTLGDSFMVAFASARKAVECAVAVQRTLEEHNRRSPSQQVQVRIGLNTGEVVQEGDDLFGAAVDAAKRIESKAKGGQVLVSEAVRAVIGPPFVGREAERAELRRCLDQVARGQGALVMIGGEPGVGKTRLAEEVMAEARQRGMTALIGHCYEMEGAPPYIPS